MVMSACSADRLWLPTPPHPWRTTTRLPLTTVTASSHTTDGKPTRSPFSSTGSIMRSTSPLGSSTYHAVTSKTPSIDTHPPTMATLYTMETVSTSTTITPGGNDVDKVIPTLVYVLTPLAVLGVVSTGILLTLHYRRRMNRHIARFNFATRYFQRDFWGCCLATSRSGAADPCAMSAQGMELAVSVLRETEAIANPDVVVYDSTWIS